MNKTEQKQITIKVCMGSSCFARGNAANLEFIENFIKEHDIDAKMDLFGSRCENKCAEGPNVIIDGEIVPLASKEKLERILQQYIK